MPINHDSGFGARWMMVVYSTEWDFEWCPGRGCPPSLQDRPLCVHSTSRSTFLLSGLTCATSSIALFSGVGGCLLFRMKNSSCHSSTQIRAIFPLTHDTPTSQHGPCMEWRRLALRRYQSFPYHRPVSMNERFFFHHRNGEKLLEFSKRNVVYDPVGQERGYLRRSGGPLNQVDTRSTN